MILPVLLNPAHLIGAPEVIAVGWLGLPFFLGGSLAGLLAIRTRTVVLAIPRARIRQIQVFTVTTFTSYLWIHPQSFRSFWIEEIYAGLKEKNHASPAPTPWGRRPTNEEDFGGEDLRRRSRRRTRFLNRPNQTTFISIVTPIGYDMDMDMAEFSCFGVRIGKVGPT